MDILISFGLFFFWTTFANVFGENYYSLIKEIDGIIYVGGRNALYVYSDKEQKIILGQHYQYDANAALNDRRNSISWEVRNWKMKATNEMYAFDTCLDWLESIVNETVRLERMKSYGCGFRQQQYFTPTSDWSTTNWMCTGNFIRGLLPYDNETLWVCGTFGSFPKAFLVDKRTLKFVREVDTNFMSCGRYWDEPVAAYKTETGDIYVGSGWGLYRPDKHKPDVPDNNSTMLYADWRLYKNLFTSPSAMAFVLSSDVNFIDVVKETDEHLFFFGHEVSNQYGLNNQEDRHAWQSFMVRLCKADLGFRYFPTEISADLHQYTGNSNYILKIDGKSKIVSPSHRQLGYNSEWYDTKAHLPKKHFVSPLKVNFGCYIGRRPRSISDNHYWGETNVVYLNKLADVIFDPKRKVNFRTKNNDQIFGCSDEAVHSQIPLMGIFNGPGIKGTGAGPIGALCQLQINENIFNELGSQKKIYGRTDLLSVNNAYEEIMSLSSMSYSNFYSRTMHRTNGYTLYPYWNQGVLIGNNQDRKSYHGKFTDVGKCHEKQFYDIMTKDKFMAIQNFSNLAWPNELVNRGTTKPSSVCQFSSAELYGFNATFVVPGVEFKRVFLLKDNITDYVMHHTNVYNNTEKRKFLSPLMVVVVVSVTGSLYRVVLCDFDNSMVNHGIDKTEGIWYDWCVFRFSDQPYVYRHYAPMEKRDRGELAQYRASSLLKTEMIVNRSDLNIFPQFHTVKDILRKENTLLVVTATQIYHVPLFVDCLTYRSCIDCASDPFCMWSSLSNSCFSYDANKFQSFTFIQDVLDRGFMCASIIKESIQTFLVTENILESAFICKNAGFFRGTIHWMVDGITINRTGDTLVLPNSEMQIVTNVTCFGMREDKDKLPYGEEYEWIKLLPKQKILLNTFRKGLIPQYKLSTCLIVITIVGLCVIIVLQLVLLYLVIFNKKFYQGCQRRMKIMKAEDSSTIPLKEGYEKENKI